MAKYRCLKEKMTEIPPLKRVKLARLADEHFGNARFIFTSESKEVVNFMYVLPNHNIQNIENSTTVVERCGSVMVYSHSTIMTPRTTSRR